MAASIPLESNPKCTTPGTVPVWPGGAGVADRPAARTRPSACAATSSSRAVMTASSACSRLVGAQPRLPSPKAIQGVGCASLRTQIPRSLSASCSTPLIAPEMPNPNRSWNFSRIVPSSNPMTAPRIASNSACTAACGAIIWLLRSSASARLTRCRAWVRNGPSARGAKSLWYHAMMAARGVRTCPAENESVRKCCPNASVSWACCHSSSLPSIPDMTASSSAFSWYERQVGIAVPPAAKCATFCMASSTYRDVDRSPTAGSAAGIGPFTPSCSSRPRSRAGPPGAARSRRSSSTEPYSSPAIATTSPQVSTIPPPRSMVAPVASPSCSCSGPANRWTVIGPRARVTARLPAGAGPPCAIAAATRRASTSAGSAGWLTAGRSAARPEPCCTTWVSSCASSSRSYPPPLTKMSVPTVNARACTDRFSSSACPPVCTRTADRSVPKCPSISVRSAAGSSRPPPRAASIAEPMAGSSGPAPWLVASRCSTRPSAALPGRATTGAGASTPGAASAPAEDCARCRW